LHTLALYWLLEWLRAGKARQGLAWIVFAALAVHCQHLFVTVLPLEALFVGWRIVAHKTPVRIGQLVTWCAVGVALLLPALPQAFVFLRQGTALSFALAPSWTALAQAVVPPALAVAVVLVGLIEWSSGRRPAWTAARPGQEAALLAAVISLAPVVLLFALSRLSSIRVFEPRYLLPALPGMVILWGWLLEGLEPRAVRRLAVIGALAHTLLWQGGFRLVPDMRGEDWRAAVRALPDDGALAVYPGLVETRRLDWLEAPEHKAYFLAPVSAYRSGLEGRAVFVLPFEMGPRELAYAERLADGPLRRERRISVLVRGLFDGPAWSDWLASRLVPGGYELERRAAFGGVELRVFRDKGAAAGVAGL
jgi:hypothetical protein